MRNFTQQGQTSRGPLGVRDPALRSSREPSADLVPADVVDRLGADRRQTLVDLLDPDPHDVVSGSGLRATERVDDDMELVQLEAVPHQLRDRRPRVDVCLRGFVGHAAP